MRPFTQINKNAGTENINYDNVGGTMGIDVKTGKVVDMFESQIVDPAKVIKNAVRNAISVASTALTIQTALVLNRTEEQIATNFINKQKQW